MAAIGESVATHVAESLADKAMQELKYLCCYKSYVDNFEEEKTSLSAKRSGVLKDIEEAKGRSENQIENEVELWLDIANGLIEEDTKGKKKWFGLVTDCFWQYQRGKELEGKTQTIKQLKENSFTRVARSTGLPGIEFYSSQNFMQFEGRKLQIEKLTEALKDGKNFMIGLYGLGGTGKTTMALQVGKEVEESKVFDKVIFSVVSKDENLKNIRDNIAKHLNLPLNEGMDELEQAQKLWKRIVEGEEKVLIILDDMWEKLALRDIGIPLGRHAKGCCAILLTTRDFRVCTDMGCHETIELEVLKEKDAVDLFLSYASKSIDGSSNDFKDVALDIVKECGRLPVAIVAVARALKSRPLKEWEQALERLRNLEPVHDVKEDLKEAYNSLRLSYDHLNEKAKQLFLLCSLFPEDYEIPIEFLTRMAIGLGLCGEAKKYSAARSRFTPIKNELTDSCLLLKVGNEYVKMHDLVREVALWIGNRQVQVVMDSNTTLMENVQYLSWNILDFPNHFDWRSLEVLLVWLNKAHAPIRKVSDAIYEGMENLRILALMIQSKYRNLAGSLFQSPLSLTNVRTLAIKNLEIGDLSMLVNFKSLESLELSKCLVVELPNKIRELEKLRLLEMVQCVIERNNPLKVIGSCSQLEELYYVGNYTDKSLAQMTTLPKLERYYIKGGDDITISNICGVNFPMFKFFASRVNLSNEVFKSLVEIAEVLKLGGDYDNRGWTNIVPDMLPVKDDKMKDQLTRLSLDSLKEIKCLIHTKHLRYGVPIFSKLVELQLFDMDVKELCCGRYPVDFLKQLKMLKLSRCQKLESMLFDGKLYLCNLKFIYLFECSMTCLFHPSTVQSLKQLEVLEINGCFKLKYIVAETMDDDDSNQKSLNDSIFPKLKYLKLVSCPELEFILPICFCQDLPLLKSMGIFRCVKLKYIFGQYPEERDLYQLGKQAILPLLEEVEIREVPNFIDIYAECYLPKPCSGEVQKSSLGTKVEGGSSNLSRGLLCCFWLKSNASTRHHPSAFMNTQLVHLDHNQEVTAKYLVNGAHGLFITPLYPGKSLRRIRISGLHGLKSLFTLSIASSLHLLEALTVTEWDALEHIITDEVTNSDGHMNVPSVFPNLQQVDVSRCVNLEYVFPAFYSKDFKHLESVKIWEAEKMEYVFGKCHADQDHNVQSELNLPTLKELSLHHVPNMVSFCAKNYSVKVLSLQDIRLNNCPQLSINTVLDLSVDVEKSEDFSKRKALSFKEKGKPLSNSQELPDSSDIYVVPKNYSIFRNLSQLTLVGCEQLKFIVSASNKRSIPELRKLFISDCEELASIIEDDEENQQNPLDPHQPCFQKLSIIEVKNCKKLKCLFSVSTCAKLPRLLLLEIEDAPELVQVFEWKQGAPQEMVIKDVLPNLIGIRLVNLPSLHTIYQGIDFQTVKIRLVRDCKNIPLANVSSTEIFNFAFGPLRQEQMNFKDPDDKKDVQFIIIQWAHKESCIKESKGDQEELEEGIRLTVGPQRLEEPTNNLFTKETTNKVALAIPPATTTTTEMTSPLSEELSEKIVEKDSKTHEQNNNSPNLKESTTASANEIVEEKVSTTPSSNSDLNLRVTYGETHSLEKYDKASSSTYSKLKTEKPVKLSPSKDKIMNQPETSTEKLIKFDQENHQQFEGYDLMRLFQITKEGADMEVDMPYLSKVIADLQDNKELSKAFADLEGSLKMSLNEIASSEESRLRLENALNILSSHCSEDGAPSHGLHDTIHTLQQEIQTILTSFNQAYATIDKFTELEQKENLMIEQRSKREKAAKTLLSDINNTKNFIAKAKSSVAEDQLKEAELKERICKLQAEMRGKEEEIEEWERRLLCLQEQEEKSVSDTIGFIMEFLAMEKERSQVVEDQMMKARQQLQNMDTQWSSCLSNLKKTALLLGVHLKQKL